MHRVLKPTPPNRRRPTRRQQFLSQALSHELIGIEDIHDSVWNVRYDESLLGRFDERTRTITGAPSLKQDC